MSTFSGPDKEDEQYLKEFCPPLNVVEDNVELLRILTTVTSTNDTVRDPGAAIRDAAQLLSQYKNAGGSILYMMTRYSPGGTIVQELNMTEALLDNNIQLIVLEQDDTAPNQLSNLNRIIQLTDGFHFPYFSGDDLNIINEDSANQVGVSSQAAIQSLRHVVSKFHENSFSLNFDSIFCIG